MAQSKSMNEAKFAKIVKELDSVGEFIRTKQKEKQSVFDSFEKEKARFKSGKISEATLASSVKKVNVELSKLDKVIREAIIRAGKISGQARDFAGMQKPKVFRCSLSGFSLSGSKKKKAPAKKKVAAKKAPKKPASKKKGVKPSKTILAKEKVLDLKFLKK